MLHAFAGARLTRLVLRGSASAATLGALRTQPSLRTLEVAIPAGTGARSLRSLSALTELETLVLHWEDALPALPRMRALRMFVRDGSVDERLVAWLAARPHLRTVHVGIADEVLAPRLPRARVYSIARHEGAEILPAPIDL